MVDSASLFESIVRRSTSTIGVGEGATLAEVHPFDERNIHPLIVGASKKLFDDGHYSQATFEAYKLLDKEVQSRSNTHETGVKLMMKVFSEQNPVIKLNDMSGVSDRDEQEGYKFIFSGSIMAIRNPRGHEVQLKETPTECLDHLSLASMLLRRLESIGQ